MRVFRGTGGLGVWGLYGFGRGGVIDGVIMSSYYVSIKISIYLEALAWQSVGREH